jgi:phosphate:Na+ symporter
MTSANSLILGLGLFFLGLRLIGENLRRLYGSSFRNVIKRTTHSPLERDWGLSQAQSCKARPQ